MKVLALQLEKSSGCALMIDGKIIFSSSEERFSRIKSDSLFPKKSLRRGVMSGFSQKKAICESNNMDEALKILSENENCNRFAAKPCAGFVTCNP